MKKHLPICAAREGITYVFDKGQITTFQIKFKYLGNVPFTVYFDFETTTTGGSVCFLFDLQMFVVSYCQIYSFHSSLNLDIQTKLSFFKAFNKQLKRYTT